MSAAPVIGIALKYKVIFQRGPLAGQSFVFERPTVSLGRGSENDLVLANDLRASRQHAEIRYEDGVLKIFNTSTKNFIVVNGNEEESAILESGSVVLVGESEFRLEISAAEPVKAVAKKEIEEPKTKLIVVEVNTPPAPRPISEMQPPYLQPTATTPIPPVSSMPPASPMAGPLANPLPNQMANAYLPPRSSHSAPPRGMPSHNFSKESPLSNPRVRFYAIIGVVAIAGFWFFTSGGAKKKELTFRFPEQIERDLEASREEIKEFSARRDRLDNVQYRRAQENYIRGFRDYKQGNYGRARESFQVVLNLDPDNELAKRYYHLSKVKFDEMVKFHMLQGNRYREKKNWRMCRSSYFNVMTMVNNPQDPLFKEAKQYLDQCSLAQQGTY